MTQLEKEQIMKLVGKRTDGVKYNMTIWHSEDTSGWLDMPMFSGSVTSLDEMEEYYYKAINSIKDLYEFVENATNFVK